MLYSPGRKIIQSLTKISAFLVAVHKADQHLQKLHGVKGGRIIRKSIQGILQKVAFL